MCNSVYVYLSLLIYMYMYMYMYMYIYSKVQLLQCEQRLQTFSSCCALIQQEGVKSRQESRLLTHISTHIPAMHVSMHNYIF